MVRVCRYFLDRGEPDRGRRTTPHRDHGAARSRSSGDFETTGDLVLASSQISRLLCDSKLQVIVTGADGKPLDVGAPSTGPHANYDERCSSETGRCRYPGCDRTHGEVHHVIAFPDGPTVLVNLVFLCDYHHHVLHKPGWHATFDGTTFTVTNPDGRRIGST